ncbi:uncharacterized protein si:dkey-262k9.2 [Neoarius graeffei]|uniref:uncharacterized protein si:dkey-262k9.2 n=1 Tax=Neoarius graeffei TaxID=443677 RepID=UPI00298C7FB4|nr:uncharacterized protein si:dkey-262k9.2 [Neoarius graeffei]
MMLRLLLLTLLLMVKAATSDHVDGSGHGEFPDEEQDDEPEIRLGESQGVKHEFDDGDAEDGNTTIIIIAAVCVVTLAVVAVIAVVLFRRHLQRREQQGVYSVPVEQGQKGV